MEMERKEANTHKKTKKKKLYPCTAQCTLYTTHSRCEKNIRIFEFKLVQHAYAYGIRTQNTLQRIESSTYPFGLVYFIQQHFKHLYISVAQPPGPFPSSSSSVMLFRMLPPPTLLLSYAFLAKYTSAWQLDLPKELTASLCMCIVY